MKTYTKENPLVVYKFLEPGGKAPWGAGTWPLPKNGKPGADVTADGELEICSNGLHGFTGLLSIIRGNLYAEDLYVAQ